MYKVEDQVVLITGAAVGIGAGLVEAFLEKGAKFVAALDIDVKNGTALETKLGQKYGKDKVKFYKCDVTTSDLETIYDTLAKEQGQIDVVVNNAGIMNDSPALYQKQIDINVTAVIRSSFKAYELMRNDRGGNGGTIINISSIVGLFHAHVLPVYAATKSAVLQFSACLGGEPHYSNTGVRVITICFGCTDTALLTTSKMAAFDKELDLLLEEGLKSFPYQKIEDAVRGLLHAYENGDSASTWLITSGLQAENITDRVTQAYGIMSQGVFTKTAE